MQAHEAAEVDEAHGVDSVYEVDRKNQHLGFFLVV